MLLAKNNVKTLKRIRQSQMGFYIHTLATHLRLFIIVQSIYPMFFVTFTTPNRKLLYTFVFDKMPSYDVTIPGSDSEITWKLPTNLLHIHTKYKVYSCRGTVFF